MKFIILATCTAVLVVYGIGISGKRGASAASSSQQSGATKPQAATPPAPMLTPEATDLETGPSVRQPAHSSAIEAFRQWAEKAVTAGFSIADETRGMELAKARSTAMKALIQTDPASALRQALSAELRAALPPAIAVAIEQPVKTSGTVSLRMMCKHSSDADHGGCESAPVLLQDAVSLNAYYDGQKWRSHLGQTVQLDGIAVAEELAVRSVTPVPAP